MSPRLSSQFRLVTAPALWTCFIHVLRIQDFRLSSMGLSLLQFPEDRTFPSVAFLCNQCQSGDRNSACYFIIVFVWLPSHVWLLCDAMGYSPPGSSVHGISQAKTVEWLSFPSPGDLLDPGIKLTSPALAGGFFITEPHAYVLSRFNRVRLCATLWTAALQAPLSTGFSRQKYWSGLPFLSPKGSPNQLYFNFKNSLWKICKVNKILILHMYASTYVCKYESMTFPQCDGIWGWCLKEVVRPWRWSPHEWDCCLR